MTDWHTTRSADRFDTVTDALRRVARQVGDRVLAVVEVVAERAAKLLAFVAGSVGAAGRHWLRLLAVVCVLVFVWLGLWNERFANDRNGGKSCAEAAWVFEQAAAKELCAEQLRRVAAAAIPGDARTCAPDGKGSWLCSFDEPSKPRLFVWVDNALVALYTGFFVGAICLTYGRLRPLRRPEPWVLRLAFLVSMVSCFAGALVDYSENFWLLAHIGKALEPPPAGLDTVATLGVWKFQLFALNVALVAAWSARAAWRGRVPYPVLLRWPRFLWDRRSRAWFDATSVRFQVANVAQAYPLYPRHLIGLSGALWDAELRCAREGDRMVIGVRSGMLVGEHAVVVRLDVARRRIRGLDLTCPNLVSDFRDQGLDERIVLAVCCTAWRLGAVVVESTVGDSAGEADRAQQRRWVRLALRLGWDATLPESARSQLPPGLDHVRRVQELLLYPDGRQWWLRTRSVPLTLRFVCDPEGAQRAEWSVQEQLEGKREFDEERLAIDRLCLKRLQVFAVRRGIRLGL